MSTGADFYPSHFKSEEYSDCTIICGPYHFKVHKLVIGAHSGYFRTALKADTFQVCLNLYPALHCAIC